MQAVRVVLIESVSACSPSLSPSFIPQMTDKLSYGPEGAACDVVILEATLWSDLRIQNTSGDLMNADEPQRKVHL